MEKAKSFFKDIFKHVAKEREWRRPSDKDFCKKAAKAKGAGGPDGWTSEEVKMLPKSCIELFAMISRQWEVQGRAPKSLKIANQKNLVKDKKVKIINNVPVLDAGDTRPISVFSVWWRLWASCWATSRAIKSGGPWSSRKR